MPRHSGGYEGLDQTAGLQRPWWHHVPRPISTAAVTVWSGLPHVVRAPFIPLGRWLNPHQSTAGPSRYPAADDVAGVVDLRRQGFEPIEEYTGAVEVARLWPEAHRRSVAETRPEWLDGGHPDGRLWLVRSPWPSLSLSECLNVLWSWVERDQPRLTQELWRQRVSEALAWDEAAAADWHQRTVLRGPIVGDGRPD